MRILHTVQSAGDDARSAVRELSERLAARGHQVTIATDAVAAAAAASTADVAIVPFAIRGNFAAGFHGDVNAYLDFLRAFDADVMVNFALETWPTDLALLAVSELRTAKALVMGGLPGLHLPAFASYYRLLPHYLQHYDRIIVQSRNDRGGAFLRKRGIDRHAIIPPAVRAEDFAMPPNEDFRSRNGIATDAFVVVVTGRYGGLSGHEEAVDIVARAQVGDATLLFIVSNAAEKEALETALARPIAMLGRRSQGRKRALCCVLTRAEEIKALWSADVRICVPLRDCAPIDLLESVASGTPFITNDTGSSRDIAEATGAGLLAPGQQHETGHVFTDVAAASVLLTQLYQDAERGRRMGDGARRIVLEHYTWDRIVERYETLYREIAAVVAAQ